LAKGADQSRMKRLDNETLAALRALDPGGRDGVVRELFDAFLSETPSRLDDIERLIHEGQSHEASREAGILESAADSIGATKLAQLCAKLETMGRNDTLSEADEVIDSIKQEFQKLQREIMSLPELKSVA
jgi:HPt (histidine-containing phosphotransfer) domain-containing protein